MYVAKGLVIIIIRGTAPKYDDNSCCDEWYALIRICKHILRRMRRVCLSAFDVSSECTKIEWILEGINYSLNYNPGWVEEIVMVGQSIWMSDKRGTSASD